MERASRLAAVLVLARLAAPAAASAAPDARDNLARARALYNQKQFEAAINAAEQARLIPSRADSADLVAARAYLERFRVSAASDDLTNARERLRRLDPLHFTQSERAEFIVGLGEALFFDESYGAAADVFGSALAVTPDAAPDSRERTLDWWATSLDRDARPRPELDRQNVYQRIRDRMAAELVDRPASAAAAYWLAAAARAQGDLQAAWDAAEAAWVRAPLGSDRGQALRADLDRLVLDGIVPERARVLALSPENVRADWERFKERWKRD